MPLLKRGIGIHHGGLLPILKEVIEILFQEGLVKCLFATETFSIGINMPAKTVIFTSTRKFDGQDFRWITSGEYIQMSGRAGRRGKDDRGIVIQMLDEKMEPDVVKGMIYGASDPLHSSYHVGYNMVLNMLRVEDADPESLLRLSFHQYQAERHAPELEAQAEELQREALTIVIEEDEIVEEYHSKCKMLEKCKEEMAITIREPSNCVPFLQSGRMVNINSSKEYHYGWGVIININKGSKKSSLAADHQLSGEYILDVFLERTLIIDGTTEPIQIVQVSIDSLNIISAVRLTLPKDFTRDSAKDGVKRAIIEVKRRFEVDGGNIPVLDPVVDMSISTDSFLSLVEKANDLNKRITSSSFHTASDRIERLETYSVRLKLLEESRKLRLQARESQAITMKEDLRKMKRVLRRLGYISTEGVLGTKGRFCCELSTGDELVLTDMIFEGLFNDLNVEQTVAILSCFVFKEPSKEDKPKIRADLEDIFQKLQSTARNVAKVSIDAKLAIDEDEYVKAFNPALMDVAYLWSKGAKFIEVCKLTDVFEGSIIRCLRRLEELLRQLGSAATAIGNTELKMLFEEGANNIRRGVVFAASLYL